jgi:transcriptional regulator with XRE-family HTH domain
VAIAAHDAATGEEMKELEVSIRLRNNLLKERRESLGMTQAQLAQAANMSLQRYGALESMSISPITNRGDWTRSARAISSFYDVDPEKLFPVSLTDIKKSFVERKFDACDFVALLTSYQEHQLDGPDDRIDHSRQLSTVNEIVHDSGVLTEIEQAVLSQRFGLNGEDEKDLKTVGDQYNLSRERIRQLQEQALGKVRREVMNRTR